jgi:hypothetical protein
MGAVIAGDTGGVAAGFAGDCAAAMSGRTRQRASDRRLRMMETRVAGSDVVRKSDGVEL